MMEFYVSLSHLMPKGPSTFWIWLRKALSRFPPYCGILSSVLGAVILVTVVIYLTPSNWRWRSLSRGSNINIQYEYTGDGNVTALYALEKPFPSISNSTSNSASASPNLKLLNQKFQKSSYSKPYLITFLLTPTTTTGQNDQREDKTSLANEAFPAVVIFPGGGYLRVGVYNEGVVVAKYLNTVGISAIVVVYRLPEKFGTNAPLEDAIHAIKVTRANALQWNINPRKIGVLGFSAGAHLAATLCAHYGDTTFPVIVAPERISRDPFPPGYFDAPPPPPPPPSLSSITTTTTTPTTTNNSNNSNNSNSTSHCRSLKEVSARPDFAVLVYPVITLRNSLTHLGSREKLLGMNRRWISKDLFEFYCPELHVTSSTPPTLLIQSQNDSLVSAENAKLYYQACKEAGVDVELYLLQGQGHGYSIGNWPSLSSEEATWAQTKMLPWLQKLLDL